MTDEGIHHIVSDAVPMVVVVTMVIASAWVLKGVISAFRSRAMLRAQTELHNKILEKFGTAEEFTAYLQSDAGRKFFDNLSKEPASPLTKILSSVRNGAILTLLGIGFLLFGSFLNLSPDGTVVSMFLAIISMATGIGFIISAVISHRLAKSWGLIQINQPQASVTTANTVAP